MIKKSLSSGCPQEVYNLYSVDYFFFFFYHFIRHLHYCGKVRG